MKKYMLLILSLLILIPIISVIYWDFFFQESLNNPDVQSAGTGFLQPEIIIYEHGNQVNIAGFVLRSPMMQFSHFTYSISGTDIYIRLY